MSEDQQKSISPDRRETSHVAKCHDDDHDDDDDHDNDDDDDGGAFQDDCTALYECEEEKTMIKMMSELFLLMIGMFVKKTIMTSFQD